MVRCLFKVCAFPPQVYSVFAAKNPITDADYGVQALCCGSGSRVRADSGYLAAEVGSTLLWSEFRERCRWQGRHWDLCPIDKLCAHYNTGRGRGDVRGRCLHGNVDGLPAWTAVGPGPNMWVRWRNFAARPHSHVGVRRCYRTTTYVVRWS